MSSKSPVRLSGGTVFSKRIFPIVWFGGIGLSLLYSVIHNNPSAIVASSIVAVYGYVLMRRVVCDLVDEVWDCGDEFLVIKSGRSQRFSLTEVTDVSYTGVMDPPRITLTLRHATEFGTEVSFIPRPTRTRSFSISFPHVFSVHPIAKDLIRLIDAGRLRDTG